MKPKHVPGRLLSGLLTLCLTAFTLAPLASVQAAPTFQLLHAFGDYPSGFSPVGELVQATDGNLYGTARYGGSGGTGTVFKLKTDGTGFAVILSIPYSDGSPSAGLIQGTDGYLYGTTRSSSGNIAGTVFKVKTNGTGYVVLKDFDYFTNGADPGTRLIQGTDGTLYGTAARGGIGDAGTVFKLKPDGTGFAVLRSFDGSTTGGLPSGVVRSSRTATSTV